MQVIDILAPISYIETLFGDFLRTTALVTFPTHDIPQ